MKKSKRLVARIDFLPSPIAAALVGVLVIVSADTGSAIGHQSLYAAACSRNPGLSAYTFRMGAEIAMRHFPWLHFHMTGDGRYVRGQVYTVHFDHMPFFATSFSTIDLSPLDPSMWQARYAVRVVDRSPESTTFELRPKKSDPRDGNPLVQALVTLDSHYSTQTVKLQYLRGTIDLNVHAEEAQGYRLPAGGDVNIDMPGEALTAHATFTQYAIQQSDVAAR